MQSIRVTRTLILLAVSLLLVALAPVMAQDMMYSEAPALAALVAAGELPPVEERLPANPLVVEPIDSVGVYGGIWNRAWRGINDFHVFGRVTRSGAALAAHPLRPGSARSRRKLGVERGRHPDDAELPRRLALV